jgi:hypothetical protein
MAFSGVASGILKVVTADPANTADPAASTQYIHGSSEAANIGPGAAVIITSAASWI